MEKERTEDELLSEKLMLKNEHFSKAYDCDEQKKADEFCKGYKEFLNEVREIKRPAKPQKEDEIKSVDEAAQIVIDRINYHRAVPDAQEKCIGKLKSVLTAPQLMKFLKCEKAMQSKISRFKDGKRPGKKHSKGGINKKCNNNVPSCNKTPSSN